MARISTSSSATRTRGALIGPSTDPPFIAECYCRTRAQPDVGPRGSVTIAAKFTLALLGCVVVAVIVYAIVAVRGELARSETDIVEYEASTAHALRPAIRDVWM